MGRKRFNSGINPGSFSSDPTADLKAGDIIYNSTTNKTKVYNGTNFTEVGSGSGSGGKNYLTSYKNNVGNGDFELSTTTGWSLFNTTLTSLIPTGSITAGAASVTTFNTVSSGQLALNYSLQTASSAAWSAGQGFISDAFTIDEEDKAKPFQFSYSYKVFANPTNGNFSGTSSNTFATYIYDVTNSVWIQPAGVYNLVQSSGTGISVGSFQTSSNSTQYRIAVLAVNASAGAITMYWDMFNCGPTVKAVGAAISDWVACTPTSNFTNTTTTGFVRRVGDSAEFIIAANCTGTPGAANLTFTLPSGFVIDTAKIAFGANNSFANSSGVIRDAGSGSYNAFPYYASSTTIQVRVVNASATYGVLDSATATVPFAFATGDSAQVQFTVPIVGWSSNSVMSQDTDTRVVAFRIERSATASSLFTAGSVKQTYDVAPAMDTHGGWDSGNNRYVVPISGKYSIYGAVFASSIATAHISNLRIKKNGSSDLTQDITPKEAATSINFPYRSKTTVDLIAGDYIELFFDNQSGSTLNSLGTSTAQVNRLTIERLSGPSVIAASETVGLQINGQTATGTINATPSVAKLATIAKDTHGIYNTTTGLATIPVSGWYHIDGKVDISTSGITAGQYYAASFIINGSSTNENFFVVGATTPASGTVHTSASRYLNAGDTVGLGARSNATSPVYSSGLSGSFLTIVKAGM